MLQTPKSIKSVESSWNPTNALSELGSNVVLDRVKYILSCAPSRLDLDQIEKLSQMLVTEGKETDIDPLFLASVIRIESAFHPGAISNKGARGLMQVMPDTGQEIAGWAGLQWTGPEQLHDLEINVKFGVKYLKWLLDLYSGNYKFALTAYNRGPGNVKYIVRRHGRLKPKYTEYYQKILKAYRKYRKSLTKSGLALIAAG